jgi:hypothetical protein
MKPILTVEFKATQNGQDFYEESVPLQSPEELFEFVAVGGGCDNIPDEVNEIQMLFMAPEHANTQNPIADKQVTLELGMVYITGPLSEIVQTAEQLLDKAGRGELSESFLKVISAGT